MLSKQLAQGIFRNIRAFSSTPILKPYVFVSEYTKVICQGITGKQVIYILYLSVNSLCNKYIGDIPYKTSSRIRNKDGGRSKPKESRHRTSRNSSFPNSSRGR